MNQLPHSIELEKAVLGSILIDPECLVSLNLQARDFYTEINRNIFEVMRQIKNDQKTVDYLMVVQKMPSEMAYVTSLLNATPTSMHVNGYAAELRELRQRRDVIQFMSEMAKNAYDTSKKLDESIADVMTKLSTVSTNTNGAVHIADIVEVLTDQIEKAIDDPKELFGYPVKIPMLNRILGGFQKKEVYKISGEPGVGKSLLAFQFLMDIAEGNNGVKGVPCALFQLEMNKMAQVRRGLSYVSNVGTRKMRTGKMTGEEMTSIYDAVGKMSKLPIYIDDNAAHTTTSVRSEIARLKSHGVECVLIDYEALLKDAGDENERTAAISDRINEMTKALDVCMFTINDMTKAGFSGGQKTNANLAGSRRVIYNADVVMFLYNLSENNRYLLDIGKFREGDTDEKSVVLEKEPGRAAFAQAELQGAA